MLRDWLWRQLGKPNCQVRGNDRHGWTSDQNACGGEIADEQRRPQQPELKADQYDEYEAERADCEQLEILPPVRVEAAIRSFDAFGAQQDEAEAGAVADAERRGGEKRRVDGRDQGQADAAKATTSNKSANRIMSNQTTPSDRS